MSDNRYIGGEAPMASSVSSSSVHTARPDLGGEGEDVPNPSFDITNTQAQVPGIPTDYPTPMAVQAPNDEEMEQVVNHMKFIYDKMMFYVTKTKPAKLQELQSLASRLSSVEKSLDLVSPDSRQALVEIIEAQKAMGREIEEQITVHDKNLEIARKYVVGELETFVESYPARFNHWMGDFKWPTTDACRALQAPEAVIKFVSRREAQWYAMDISPAETTESMVIQELRRQLRELQMEKNKVNQVNQNYISTKEPVVSLGEVKNTYREKEGLSINYIMERRRRIQTPSFAKGSVSEAKDWLAEYKSVCQHLQYSEQEKLDELEVRLKGMALTWYSYLLPESKKTWNQFEQAFRDYFAGGANTVEAAMNELKQLRQGNKKMMVFGQELREVARRAEIYSDRMLIGYLKAAVNPEMTRAIIYRGPSSYAEAVNICIEVETDLLQNLAEKTSYNPPYTIAPVSTNTEVPAQNFQKKEAYGNKKTSVRCFRCKKLGHMKKDCRVTRDFGTKYGKKVNAQDTGKNNRGAENKIYEDTDINIFSQFFQANNNAEKGGDSTESSRFKVEIDTEKGSQLALVDTGSTICSIVEETVQQLGLEVYVCAPEVIRYGNSSTQVTTSKAILKFGFNNGERSTAHLYLVKEQNEPIILGMDWLVKENIILHPGSKTLSKTKLQDINSMEKVEEILQKYPELTEESKYQTLTKAPYKHRIDTGDALPNVTRDYRRSEVENQAIQKEVEGMLARRVIVPSSSDWCSPVVLIKKPDGSFRFCVDYRGLNKLTVKDKYPLPRITELLDKLNGSQYFSTIDLKSGYWQLPIDPRDAKKTAFIANGSLYEFNCLPFGVVNGPSSFMRFMHIVLKGLTQAMVYLDDVIVFSKTERQHEEDLNLVLQRLNDYNLKISERKCQFFKKEVKFLGFLVSGEGIRSDPEKVKVIKNWPIPSSIKQLMRFLGFCAFYHRFIKDLSAVAKPLYKLLKKEEQFYWSDEANAAFQNLKNQIMSLPTLAYPNPSLPYDLHCDASNFGLGSVLVQEGRPVAYASRTLTAPEQNYHTTEKECLAIVWALDYFHPYVYGADLTIYTDHAALKSILSTKLPKGRIARWIMALQSYQFTIIHRKGLLNQDADALSRLSQNSQEGLTAEMFKTLQQQDPEIKCLLKEGVRLPFVWLNGTLGRKTETGEVLPVIPRVLVPMTLKHAHDGPIGGHFGIDKTMDKTRQIGWWPSQATDVKTWVAHCEGCQRKKIRTESTATPLKPIMPSYLGEIWAADIAVLSKSKKGNRYLLVFMEYLSKWLITAALSSLDTDQVVQVLLFEVVLKLGVPARLITDNGTNFISEAMNQVCARLGIRRSLTSVEHPQTDGLVERLNRTIKTSLAICTEGNPFEWDDQLPFVTFAYNTAKQTSTGFSPFEVLFGRKARLPILPDLELEKQKSYETEAWSAYLKNRLPLIHGQVLKNIELAQVRQKRAYNKGTRVKYDYQVGDLIARKNLEKSGFPKERWSGPWVILALNNMEGTSFKITRQDDPHKHVSTANAKHMRPWFKEEDRIELISKPLKEGMM